MTPISVGEVVAGDILWAASKSLLGGTVILLIMLPLGLIEGPLALAVLPLTFAVGIMFGALGMAYTAIAPSYTFFNYFFTLVIGVMFLFSGVFFPLEGLPGWVGWAAWFLPLTHAVILMRGLTSGALAPSMWFDLAWLVAFTLLVFWLAVRLIRRRLIR
jgi:lipooligosaccharide transport system permease protein